MQELLILRSALHIFFCTELRNGIVLRRERQAVLTTMLQQIQHT